MEAKYREEGHSGVRGRAARGGSEADERPAAVARWPPRGCAAQVVHQLAHIWRPRKGTEDAHFLGRNPGAICGHHDQELFPQTVHRGRLASSDLLSQLIMSR